MDSGAKYYRCDFQVHTPRDINFTGQSLVTDEEREEYSRNFINACRDKGLDAVAITDHHDLTFYNYINDASKSELDEAGQLVVEENRIVVFPGMELTLDVPCQALIIFDSTLDITDEVRIQIYTALSINNFNPITESKTAETVRLPIKSINEIYERLNSVESLKNKFTVFPNVKDGGSDSIFRTGFHNEYANGSFVGGYLDREQYNSHKDRLGWNNILNGKVEAYGNRSIGLFQTSDNRIDTFEHLGISTTWVKWSAPTAEGLRQACLAKRSRILQDEPIIPNIRIASVEINGSAFLKNIKVSFNPQFNVLIGGRGTGKSSLLQYIAWVLGKDYDSDRSKEIIAFVKNTLGEGSVILEVIKNNVLHSIRRSDKKYEIKIGDDDWQDTNSENIVTLIQADSFAQKELSKHEKNRTHQLTKLIEYSINDELGSIHRKVEDNSNKIKESVAVYESYVSNLKQLKGIQTQIESIEEQIKNINEQLNDVPVDDQTTIKNNNLVETEKDIVKTRDQQITSVVSQINQIITETKFFAEEIEPTSILNTVEIDSFSKAHIAILNGIKHALENTILNATSLEYTQAKTDIEGKHIAHDVLYAEAKQRQSQFEAAIQALEALRKRLNILLDDKNKISIEIDKGKATHKKLLNYFHERQLLNIQKWGLINTAKINITTKSDKTLEIEISVLENVDAICGEFIEKVTSSKGQPERTKTFFDLLKKGNATYKMLLKFWLSLYKAKAEGGNLEELLAVHKIINTSLIENDFKRIIDSLDTASIIDFALELPSYTLVLKYCKDAHNKIPFEDASYGQQAGAILTILLNQEFGPLIIDQPEDDLDNKVIHQITENIITAKHKRQLIFSSHNANVAVNGDAELILCFDHNADKSAGEILNKGSIDRPEIKETVKDVMEGGKIAFELRKTKYGF
jgi:chromosome segregation protein